MIELTFQPYRLFPYERELALRELEALGLDVLSNTPFEIVAGGDADPAGLKRLTYFSEVRRDGTRIEPDIALIERQHLARRNGARRPRQATRYSVHGLHEYKGKFHPHVVRAFANILDVRPGDLVIDPFCGSGTTLAEALLIGATARGLDLSPIAVLLSEAKVAVLHSPDRGGLATRLRDWSGKAVGQMERAESRRAVADRIDPAAAKYLAAWFRPSDYAALIAGLAALEEVSNDRELHLLGSVVLSSVLRRSSLQAPEDLRVRRRRPDSIPERLVAAFAAAAYEAVEAVSESALLPPIASDGGCSLGDVTERGLLSRLRGGVERAAVITSPPYATALPYVDTDRLSLVSLGLLRTEELRPLEASLVGSREWRGAEEREWDRRLTDNASELPSQVVATCRSIKDRNGTDAGFRRRAVPGLLYRYFSQMGLAFAELRDALKPRERAVFIVGVNRTGAGSNQVLVDTPHLLGILAEHHGFQRDELIRLNTWPRYGLHHENGVPGESALLLTAI